ncbi:hypothetical protein CGRA01v4_09546 [Colletotrichum graminicola]|nr:hypothetical protein CGRA01v4_09546 [Colletotrichum graminicola]
MPPGAARQTGASLNFCDDIITEPVTHCTTSRTRFPATSPTHHPSHTFKSKQPRCSEDVRSRQPDHRRLLDHAANPPSPLQSRRPSSPRRRSSRWSLRPASPSSRSWSLPFFCISLPSPSTPSPGSCKRVTYDDLEGSPRG